jgi:hypothetical protein
MSSEGTADWEDLECALVICSVQNGASAVSICSYG